MPQLCEPKTPRTRRYGIEVVPPRAELDAFSVVFHGEKAYTFRSKDGASNTTMVVDAGRQADIDHFGLLLIEEAG